MKLFITIAAIVLSSLLQGQKNDDRARIKYDRGLGNISVNQNNEIWLGTPDGEIIYFDEADSLWHFKSMNILDSAIITFLDIEKVRFFNPDTAIIFGRIHSTSKRNNCIFISKDGGKSAKLIQLDGFTWIKDVFDSETGNAWAVGSDKCIAVSNDFGEHWKTIKTPFQDFTTITGINFNNNKNGILSTDDDELYLTNSDCSFFKKIKTPDDQRLIKRYKSKYSRLRISKVFIWNDFLIVRQAGMVFYTPKDKIKWSNFPVELFDFGIDKLNNTLIGITKSLEIFEFTTPVNYSLFSPNKLWSLPYNFQVMNGSLYVFDKHSNITVINKQKLNRLDFFTKEFKIETPKHIVEAENLNWGYTENELFYSSNNKDWFRAYVFDFPITSLKSMEDSSVLVWDGIHKCYKYQYGENKITAHKHESLIQPFLNSPLEEIKIKIKSYRRATKMMNYYYLSYNLKSKIYSSFSVTAKGDTVENLNINTTTLDSLLANIYNELNIQPSISNLGITKKDKRKAKKWIRKSTRKSIINWVIRDRRKQYYYNLKLVDNLPDSSFADFLKSRYGPSCSISSKISLELFNVNNDSLTLYSYLTSNERPLLMPWYCKFQEVEMRFYGQSPAKLMNEIVPKKVLPKCYDCNDYIVFHLLNGMYQNPLKYYHK